MCVMGTQLALVVRLCVATMLTCVPVSFKTQHLGRSVILCHTLQADIPTVKSENASVLSAIL